MSSLRSTACLTLVSLFVLVSCSKQPKGKNDVEKVCFHSQELEGKGDMTDAQLQECTKVMGAVLEGCDDREEYVECFLASKNSSDVGGCACKGSSSSVAAASPGGGGDLLTRCRSECESKHGTAIDRSKLADCVAEGGGAECSDKAANPAFTSCFRSCRGL